MTTFDTEVESFTAELARRPAARAPATLGEIWSAEWASSGLQTLSGVGAPAEEAYEELLDRVKAATGREPRMHVSVPIEQRIEPIRDAIASLPEERRKEIEPFLDVRARAAEKAAKAEREAAETYAVAFGLSGVATSFVAGIARQAVDPVNLAALPAGGPLTGNVLRMLGREFLIGAAVQGIQEPAIQAGRGELGLEAGPGQAAGNILQAGAGAAGMAGLLRAGAAGLRALRGERAAPAGAPEISEPLQPGAGERISESPRPAEGAFTRESLDTAPLTPEDLEAVARVVERDQVIDATAPVQTPEGLQAHARAVDDAAAAIEAGRPVPERGPAEPAELAALRPTVVQVDGVDVRMPDPDHALLFDVGRRVTAFAAPEGSSSRFVRGGHVTREELEYLLQRFRGFAVEDPEMGTTMRTLRDVRALAREFFDDVSESAKGRTEPFEAPDMVDGDMRAAWLQRRIDEAVAPPRPALSDLPLAARPEAPSPGATAATKGPRARPEDTWSLFEFLAARGGLRPDPELDALLGGKNPFVPGFGPLIRKGGMALDRAREAAVEARYLIDAPELEAAAGGRPQNRPSESTVRDLLDTLDRQARGERVYRLGQEAPQTKAAAAAAREQRRAEIESEIDAQWREGGDDPATIDPAIRKRMVELFEKEGMTDVDVAFERAILEDAERWERVRNARQDEIGDVPGWDTPDGRAASPDGGDPAAARQGRAGERADAAASPGEGSREAGGAPGRAQGELEDPAIAADAQRVLEEAGGDLEIVLPKPDGTTERVSARAALADAAELKRAADELAHCVAIGGGAA